MASGVTNNIGVRSAGDERQAARQRPWKYAQPAGTATNLHKNMATGTSLSEGEDKALTKAQVERRDR